MAPPRGRRKKATASPAKPAVPTPADIVTEQPDSEPVGAIASLNPKENNDIEVASEAIEKSSSGMEIEELAFPSADSCSTEQPETDADSQLLYEGDDGFTTDVNQEVSYAPEDVDALLGDDDNEGLDSAVEDFVTEEESTYPEGAEDGDAIDTGDSQGEGGEGTDVKDVKQKAKLVKTTYHYVNDKTEETPGYFRGRGARMFPRGYRGGRLPMPGGPPPGMRGGRPPPPHFFAARGMRPPMGPPFMRGPRPPPGPHFNMRPPFNMRGPPGPRGPPRGMVPPPHMLRGHPRGLHHRGPGHQRMMRPPQYSDYGGEEYYEDGSSEDPHYSEQMDDGNMQGDEMHTESNGNPKPLMAIRTPADIKAEVAARNAVDEPKTSNPIGMGLGPRFHPSLRRGTGRGGKGNTSVRGSHAQASSSSTTSNPASRAPMKRTHSDTMDTGRGRGGYRGGLSHPHSNSNVGQNQAMDIGEPAAKIQAGASQMHSNLRHIRTVEQHPRGRGTSTPTRISNSGTLQRGGYVPRGSSTAANATSTFRPQRPINPTRPSFQVSHTPAPTLTTLVGGNADGSGSSNKSQYHANRAHSTGIRPSSSTHSYSNQERSQPPITRPPTAGYTPAPRHQTAYQHQPMATQQTVTAPPPVSHQIPPPNHYQQNQSIPGAITYPTHTQQVPAPTYAYQPRPQAATAPSSYIHTPAPSTSYAAPVQRPSYTGSVPVASHYPSATTSHTLVHPSNIPVAAAPRSAKAMITNLPPNATFGRISSMTETCGVVRTINVRSENNSAVIEFVHPESVDSFIRSYHQQLFDNVMINVYRVV